MLSSSPLTTCQPSLLPTTFTDGGNTPDIHIPKTRRTRNGNSSVYNNNKGSSKDSSKSVIRLIVLLSPFAIGVFMFGLFLGNSAASSSPPLQAALSFPSDVKEIVQVPPSPPAIPPTPPIAAAAAVVKEVNKPPPIPPPPIPPATPPIAAAAAAAVVKEVNKPLPPPPLPPPPSISLTPPPPIPTSQKHLPTPPGPNTGWLSLPTSMDFATGSTLSVFVNLSGNAGSGIRTILSNKASGCPNDAAHKGFSLYVNNWESSDQRLVVEYGTSSTGCAKLDTALKGVKVQTGEWTHIAVSFDAVANTIAIYINGKQSGVTTLTESRPVQKTTPMSLGINNEGIDPMNGKMSTLAIYDTALSDIQIGRLYTSGVSADVMKGLDFKPNYLYPLIDAYRAIDKGTSPAIEAMNDYKGGVYHFDKVSDFVVAGGGRYKEYADGTLVVDVTESTKKASDALARDRRAVIKSGMIHAWSGYKKYAYGFDELKPLSMRGQNNWGGMGTTLVDSLDTLWLMGLKDDFWEGRDWVRDHLDHEHVGSVSVFETTIRSLGGLLAAYDLSLDKAFLDKAEDLGKRLFRAFDSPSGIPYGQTQLNGAHSSNAGWTGGTSLLAEIGTLQVEFRYLSKVTGNPIYKTKADKVFEIMAAKNPPNGLFPININPANGSFKGNKITFGAMGDSFYEYMLKCWLQGGKTEPLYREMYDKSMDGVHSKLAQRSKPSGLAYIADLNNGNLDHKMDHLVCFMGGSLVLGAYSNPEGIDSVRSQRDLKLGKSLAYTCYQMYARMATGIAPEYVRFTQGSDFKEGSNAPFYILRPETMETFFLLHQLTGDPMYREWGWEIYQAIEKYCRTSVAFGGLKNVQNVNIKPEDRMESFFLAETMKYAFLLQDPDNEIDVLNKHVFNTEAHVTRRLDLVKQGGTD